MKLHLLLLFSVLFINVHSQNIRHVTWTDILFERSIEKLHEAVSQSKDDDEKEFLENNLLIYENGYLVENKYFDVYTTKKIKEKRLGQNMFCDKKELTKVFRLLKTNKISFLKATIKSFHFNAKNKYYVFFETMSANKSKEDGFNLKYYNTFALFVYSWNDDLNNGTYELERFDLFGH